MIKAETLNFLKQIAINNDRNWFQAHKDEYNTARENVLDFTSHLLKELATLDPTIPADLSAQSCLMRIYRDVRFSKNKAPYKTNFGIAMSGSGKNFNGPGYYIHLQPGKSFVAAGYWMPEANHLKAIRQEIDYNSGEFHHIIDNPSFKTCFGKFDEEDKLKTSPKGYSSDHPDIEYLRLKSFAIAHEIKDEKLNKADTIPYIINVFEKVYPLMVFLRNAIS
jgi:uncharacterized protein (TIGR02453 family)